MEFKNEQIEKAKRFIKSRYPQFNEKDLVIVFSKKNPLVLVVLGPRGGETIIFLKDGSDFQQDFLNKTFVQKALGKPAPSVITKAKEIYEKGKKKLGEVRQNERRYRLQIDEKEKEENDLQQRIRSEEEKLQQLQDDPAADKRLLEEKRPLIENLKKDYENKQREKEQLQKKYEDNQKTIKNSEQHILQEKQTIDSLKKQFNSTQSFDALKKQESSLMRQNEEDQAIIDDEDATALNKEAAKDRIATRNEEDLAAVSDR